MGNWVIDFYKTKIKRETKLALFSSFVIGLLIHIFKFANTLPNRDSLYNYYSSQNIVGLGRWLLSLACGISSYFDLPWINGLLSVVYIAITAAIIVEILEIKNPFIIVISGGILVSYPATAEILCFGFTADGYMLGMLISSLAVLLTRVERLSVWRSALAALCICCSCAIYQATLSFALVLALCYLILKLFDNAFSKADLKKWILSQLGVYVIGLASYYLIWKLMLRFGDFAAKSYQGVSELSLSISTVISAVGKSLVTFLTAFFERNPLEHGFTLYSALNLIFLVALTFGLIFAVVKTKIYLRISHFVLLVISAAAIPFGSCIWFFTSPTVIYRTRMLQSLCIIYILAAILYERYFGKITKNLFALLMAVIVFNCGIKANITYYEMERVNRNSFAIAGEMVEDLHALNTSSKEIVFVGRLPIEGETAQGLTAESHFFYSNEQIVLYLNETFYEEFTLSDYDWDSDKAVSDVVDKMECWPSNNGLKVVDNIIFIKLSESD